MNIHTHTHTYARFFCSERKCMMWMCARTNRQSRLALRLNATLQTKQSQLRLQPALCCAVDAPCRFCSGQQWTCWLTLRRQMCCEHCFQLVEPLTWCVLKGKHVGVLLLFLVQSRELGGGVGRGESKGWGACEQQERWRLSCLSVAMIWVSETVPAQCSLSAGTPRHCLPLAETLKSWIGVAAGRVFLSFITERGDWKKIKKAKWQPKVSSQTHVYWFWAAMIASSPRRHASLRSAGCMAECAAVRFLASWGQMKPGSLFLEPLSSRGFCRSKF